MIPKILFVDDERPLLNGIKRMLFDYRDKWQMVFESDAVAAELLLDKTSFDIVVLDVKMPKLSGFDLLEKLKHGPTPSDSEVIMLTGLNDTSLKRKALGMGATDLLAKPVCKDDLIARVNNVLSLKYYRDQLDEQNLALKKQLEQAQKTELIGLMAAGVIHDLKNLLGAVRGVSELALIEDDGNQKSKEDFELIHMSANRALDILLQIHHFSCSRNAQKTEVIIYRLVNDCVQLLKVIAPKTMEIFYDTDPLALQDVLLAHENDLFQVLMNLGLNAIQAMDKKGTLRIRLYRREIKEAMVLPEGSLSKGVYDVIEVADTGKGFDASEMEKLFQPYYTTRADQSGSGLGLVVVHSIVQRLNGAIQMESTPGKGTCFYIFLKCLK